MKTARHRALRRYHVSGRCHPGMPPDVLNEHILDTVMARLVYDEISRIIVRLGYEWARFQVNSTRPVLPGDLFYNWIQTCEQGARREHAVQSVLDQRAHDCLP
jgi:hypothetical protein